MCEALRAPPGAMRVVACGGDGEAPFSHRVFGLMIHGLSMHCVSRVMCYGTGPNPFCRQYCCGYVGSHNHHAYCTRMTAPVIVVSTTADALAASTSDGLTIVGREADRQLERARDSTPTGESGAAPPSAPLSTGARSGMSAYHY